MEKGREQPVCALDGAHALEIVGEIDVVREVYEASGGGLLVVAPDGAIVRVNAAMCELLGYTEAELCALTLADVSLSAHAGTAEIRPDVLVRKDHAYRRKDGEVMWGHVCARWIFDGDRPRYGVGLVRDITDRVRAEEAAAREREVVRSVHDAAPYAIVLLDERGHIESFNPAAEAMFGWSEGELLGRHYGLLLPPLAGASSRPEPGFDHELCGVRKDGSAVPLHVTVTAIGTPGRRGFCCFARDLSRIKQAEAQLRRAQKLEAVGTLASGVAHDFNNLLMGIAGCARIAGESVAEASPARTFLDEIERAAEGGIAITRQLLALGHKRESNPEVFELNELVAGHAELLRSMLGDDIELAIEPHASGSRVRADPGQVEQVLLNLVANARDAMPRGGELLISTEHVRIGAARGGGPRPGSYVMLRVSDTGCGMTAEARERLFEPFFTTKLPGKGTGLGLSIVLAIVEGAGGTVRVQSVPGRGTSFEVLLPRARDRITRELPVAVPERPSVQHGTVLLVEDDRLVRTAVRHYLETAGYKVLEARSGPDAVDCCRKYRDPVDVVVTDVVLPGLGGSEIAREVRRLKPAARLLFMSAYPEAWLLAEGRLEAGAILLHKPFNERELLDRVRALVTERAPR